jgi:hypothetical protein
MEVSGQLQALATLPTRTRSLVHNKWGPRGPQSWSDVLEMRETSVLAGNRTRIARCSVVTLGSTRLSEGELLLLWSNTLENPSSSSSSITGQTLIDLFRPRLIVPSKLFQVVFVHSVCNSTLFMQSCCCPFLLHIAANVICIFLVSCQLVLLSALPKLLYSVCGQKGCKRLFFWKIQSRLMSIFFILLSKGSNFASI